MGLLVAYFILVSGSLVLKIEALFYSERRQISARLHCVKSQLLCYIDMDLLKLKLIYDRQSVGHSVLVSGTHLGPATNFLSLLQIFFRQLRVCYFVAPSLTRGRVCNLLYNCFWSLPEQSLLGRSASELMAIFYCLI
jgi:hypothetical protein